MEQKESLQAFIGRKALDSFTDKEFYAYRIEEFDTTKTSSHRRRDFYKVSLITKSDGILYYADRSVPVRNMTLVFSNPMIPYSWERTSGNETGFFCLFREVFLHNHFNAGNLALSPLFKVGGTPVLLLKEDKARFFISLFEQILHEANSDYGNKKALLQNYLQIVIHESLKIPASEDGFTMHRVHSRISAAFLQLLQSQFSDISRTNPAQLKSVKEFADHLCVHPNYLNKALKQATNKSPTVLIQERIMTEAQTLLRHTTWDISDISHSLGFLHPSNFITFFKRRSGFTPAQFRKTASVNS